LRGDVDKTVVARELQNQIDELKRTLDSEREAHKQEMDNLKEEYLV
jgi:hypothetical protein